MHLLHERLEGGDRDVLAVPVRIIEQNPVATAVVAVVAAADILGSVVDVIVN